MATTTHDSNATPGPLKVALALWMALMAGLLGYSIATADATSEDAHPAESVEDNGTGTPTGTPATVTPSASVTASATGTPAASD
ncbi:MAG TPA: hypothetical protein VGB64_04600 [Actinomycetota bacterium]